MTSGGIAMRRHALLGVALLAIAGLAPLLPGVAAPLTALAALAGWLALRPGRTWILLVLPPLLVAALLLVVERRAAAGDREIERRAETAFARLFERLDAGAAEAAAALSVPSDATAGRRRAFEELQSVAAREEKREATPEGWTWIVFGPDGEQVAWAGRGLVHEIDGRALPLAGRVHVSSFTATSFLAIEQLGEGASAWRVGFGLTVQSDRLPGEPDPGSAMWAVRESDEKLDRGDRVIVADGLRVALREVHPPTARTPRVAPLVGAFGLLLATILLAARAAPPQGSLWLLPALAALVGASLGAGGAPLATAVAAAGVVGLWLATKRGPRAPRGPAGMVVAGVALAALLLAASALLLWRLGPMDLGSSFGGGAEALAVRLALFAVAAAFLWLVRGEDGESVGGRGLLAAAALAAGAALSGWTAFGLVALAAASVLAVSWSTTAGWDRRPLTVAAGLALAALLAALAWEIASTRALERRLPSAVRQELSPPTTIEEEAVAIELGAFFHDRSLEDLTLGAPEALDPRDLAFALWRRSPLARSGRLSSVVVGPTGEPVSTFDYGLTAAVAGSSVPVSDPTRRLPGWPRNGLEGEGMLTLGGGPWATVEYRVLLQPGFRDAEPVAGELAVGLLRRERSATELAAGLPGDVRLGLFREDGEVVLPPWRDAAGLPVDPIPDRVEAPRGWAKTFPVAVPGGWSVAFLPVSTPLRGIERVAVHATVPILLMAAFLLTLTAVRLGGAGDLSALRSVWASYSKRIVVVYTLLLMVPVLLVNVLVLRFFDQRLERERQAAGYSALESAQRVLSDYVGSLEPGFGVDTAVGDEVLLWLSRVVHHEVNLYWGSRLSASSKRELFSSGLLPPRIPGDVFARVSSGGAEVASRRTRAGDAVYEEFYAPLVLSDDPAEEPALFISIPLLAQEVATAEEMAAIRRRVLLSALALAVLLAALGRRVGSRLTRPLLQVVEATQRIAAGAPSIEVETSDSEFVTLVRAVDDMAGRIAAGRQALLEEKRLVDQMIDNVNAGVVSVDLDGRVLLANRTAQRLLGVEVGGLLADSLEGSAQLEPVREFVRVGGGGQRQSTVRLPADEGDEREWTLVWVALPGTGGPAALFVIEDVTEVLRGQRLEAWAEMARMIAHEVKNPLTPIRLSTEHLREVSRSGRAELERVLEQCTANILRQVDELQQIVAEFSVYSRIPQIERRPGDLSELVSGIVDGYRHGRTEVLYVARGGPWTASFDERLLGRAIRNLLENAVRATRDHGEVTVTLAAVEEGFEIRVADSGPGVDGKHLPRLFEPYFSTEASGTGLGLPITKRIVEEHGGSVAARNLAPRGLEVTISLPRRDAGGAG
jgi:nitrogen fixation/metabolism regulation signal transduction histidine kinase